MKKTLDKINLTVDHAKKQGPILIKKHQDLFDRLKDK